MSNVTATEASETTEQAASELKQLVVFRVGEEGFCIEINKVREINRLVEITKIPESPPFVEGIINLRGELVPVIDLRRRFGFKSAGETNNENRIMVIETEGKLVGYIVDEVREVLRIRASQIEPTPALVTSGVDDRYIKGVASINDRLLIILDSDLLFSKEELNVIAGV